MHPTITEKRAAFRALHKQGCFVLPNPWDIGGARALEHAGFKALATTSAGYAWSAGRADGHVPRDMVLAHLRQIVNATTLPVNADFESGFGADPSAVAESVRLAVETGVAGISIEDSTGDPQHPLRTIEEAVQRVRAARAAIDDCGGDTLLVGRAENFLVGQPDLDDTLRRLQAYAEAGADCLYAPGIRTPEQIRAVVAAAAPKPVNVLISPLSTTMSVRDVAALGVRRISVGGSLARVAWGAFLRATQAIVEHGRFDAFADAPTNADLNALLGNS